MKPLAQNRRAFFDYDLIEKFEAGMVLLGTEVKSIRGHRVSIKGSFVSIQNGEVWWKGGQIQPWEHSNQGGHDIARDRKLLLKKREIKKLQKSLDEKGYTLIPLSLKIIRGNAKLEIALARGRKKYDKRHLIKSRDVERRELTKV